MYNRLLVCIIMKSRRQGRILELVRAEAITSQEQLRARLRGEGIEATQATLSRDIRDLGLVKRAADGAYGPAGSTGDPGPGALEDLEDAVAEYLRTVEASEQLVVLKTDPGQAQPLAIAFDRARVPEVVGTIGGDDTILVICRSRELAEQLVARLTSLMAT
jgi:transcriptional regulator of arginine metabolism